jgi:hypothetical protein
VDVLRGANDARLTVADLELRYLQFFSTGAEDALAAYQADVARSPLVLADLAQLAADQPEQIEHWRGIVADLDLAG